MLWSSSFCQCMRCGRGIVWRWPYLWLCGTRGDWTTSNDFSISIVLHPGPNLLRVMACGGSAQYVSTMLQYLPHIDVVTRVCSSKSFGTLSSVSKYAPSSSFISNLDNDLPAHVYSQRRLHTKCPQSRSKPGRLLAESPSSQRPRPL